MKKLKTIKKDFFNFLKFLHKKYKYSKFNNISFIVVRNASRKPTQYNFICWKFFMCSFIILGIVIASTVATTYYFYDRDRLVSTNISFKKELALSKDKVKSLALINENQNSEISKLKETLAYSAKYFDDKLNQVNALESNLNNLVATLNKDSHTNVKIPITRSIDRENNIFNPLGSLEGENIYKDMLESTEEDEITLLLQEQIGQYNDLIKEIEETLDFLDCRPDYIPVNGIVTSPFGYRIHPVTGKASLHKGIDFGANAGTSIYSAGSGIVTFSGWNGEFGKVIVISHGYGYKSVYAHNSKLLVNVGDKISKGDLIAKVGNTGLTTGSHLHFEIHYNGVQVNPAKILNLK